MTSIGRERHVDLVLVRMTFGDRVRGVHQQVQKHLAQPRFVADDTRRCLELADESRALLDLVGRQRDRGFQGALEVERDALVAIAARERLEVAHDRFHARRAEARVAQELERIGELAVGHQLRHAMQLLVDHFERDEQIGEGVVDLVGNAGGEQSDRREAVLVNQLRLHLLERTQIAASPELRRPPLELDRSDGRTRQRDSTAVWREHFPLFALFR
jgi:hypothetical protein